MITCAEDYSAFKLIHEGILALSRAEQAGIRVDVDYYQKTYKRLERDIAILNTKFNSTELAHTWIKAYGSKVNFDSNDQLAKVLFNHMGIKAVKLTAKGNPSTDEEALLAVGLPDVAAIIKTRQLSKLKETYIGGFLREQVDGYVHCFFNLHNVVSFRSSCDKINFQNQYNRDPVLKNLCRTGVLPHPGQLLLCADFKGAEVCGAACYNKDPNLISYLKDPSLDMHRDVAVDCLLTTPDQIIKSVRNIFKGGFTFAQFYGDWYKSCAENMWGQIQATQPTLKNGILVLQHLATKGIKTYQHFEDQVQKVEDIFWNKRFKVYKKWKEDWFREYCDNGFFTTLTGFTCTGEMDRKQAVNYPIQGTSFHLLLMSLIILDRMIIKRGWKSRIIAQIHDELVISVEPSEAMEIIKAINWIVSVELPRIFPWINVPLIIEMEATPINGSWNHKVDLCSCGGIADMDTSQKGEFIMYCPYCMKETVSCESYEQALKTWKEVR